MGEKQNILHKGHQKREKDLYNFFFFALSRIQTKIYI